MKKNKEYSESAAQMIKVLHLEFSFHKKKIIIKHQHKFDFSALNKIQNWQLLLLVSFIHFICDSPHFLYKFWVCCRKLWHLIFNLFYPPDCIQPTLQQRKCMRQQQIRQENEKRHEEHVSNNKFVLCGRAAFGGCVCVRLVANRHLRRKSQALLVNPPEEEMNKHE